MSTSDRGGSRRNETANEPTTTVLGVVWIRAGEVLAVTENGDTRIAFNDRSATVSESVRLTIEDVGSRLKAKPKLRADGGVFQLKKHQRLMPADRRLVLDAIRDRGFGDVMIIDTPEARASVDPAECDVPVE